jgi:hypothetical protein
LAARELTIFVAERAFRLFKSTLFAGNAKLPLA